MRTIDADALKAVFEEKSSEAVCGLELCKAIISRIDEQPTVDAIVCDDNFGFAGYIIENDKYGILVEESWNKDLTDEELMTVMCGVIQDVLADERLKRLWESATEMAEFLGGYDGFNKQTGGN